MKIPRRGFLKGVLASVGAAGAAAVGLGSAAAVSAPVTKAPASTKGAFSKWLMCVKHKQVRLPTNEQLREGFNACDVSYAHRDLGSALVECVNPEGTGRFLVPTDFADELDRMHQNRMLSAFAVPSSLIGRIESAGWSV